MEKSLWERFKEESEFDFENNEKYSQKEIFETVYPKYMEWLLGEYVQPKFVIRTSSNTFDSSYYVGGTIGIIPKNTEGACDEKE